MYSTESVWVMGIGVQLYLQTNLDLEIDGIDIKRQMPNRLMLDLT